MVTVGYAIRSTWLGASMLHKQPGFIAPVEDQSATAKLSKVSKLLEAQLLLMIPDLTAIKTKKWHA
jgi:hypothetical protein